MIKALVSALVLFMCAGALAPAQQAPPVNARQSLDDAWWTGPLLAPSAGTLPRGHVLVEPYLFDVIGYGAYDTHGALQPAPHAHSYGSLTYVIYGLTDRFNVGLIPVFGYSSISGGGSSSGIGLGDWAVLAQYRLTQYRAGSWMPTTSLSLQETFPSGKYDKLGSRPLDGQGSGAYSTKLSLYTQTYFWLRNGRIVRARLNFSDTFSGAVPVSGVSVYGTGNGFSGTAHPGNAFSIDGALEYSKTKQWALAGDIVYTHAASTRVTSSAGTAVDSGVSRSLAIAPAIEYNWNANVGIIGGVRLFPAGVNTSASITPVVAINYVR